jgi:ABC-type lipoprotein release transport system permease subunit
MKMAWRNIWRNPRRTILTIIAIAFACALLIFMLSFQFGSYETMINTSVKINTGHLQIQAKNYHQKKDMRLCITTPDKIGSLIQFMPEIEAFSFRATAFSLVSSAERTYGILIMGVDPERESHVSRIKAMIREGKYLSAGLDPGKSEESVEALVGRFLAKNLKVLTGDELTILGQGKDGSIAASVIKIKGIYSSGIDELDRAAIYIPLKNFQDIFYMGNSVHQVVVICSSLKDVSKIKEKIKRALGLDNPQSKLAVLEWEELVPGLREGIELDLVSGMIFYLLLILIVAFSILNTFLMAIFERTKEFGVLMAIGTAPKRLTLILLTESAFITGLGIITGIIIGILVTFYFEGYGIYISGAEEIFSQFGLSGRIYPRLSLLSIITGPIAVFTITIFSALYPALKVKRYKPVEALRAI